MDPIADMLSQIKNAQAVNRDHIVLPSSKIKVKIAAILKEAGYLANIEKKKKKAHKAEHDYLDVELKYTDGQGAINGLKLISKPSRHMYVKADEIKSVRSGFGVAVISTSKGIMTSKEARKQGLGGEILFEIW
ncbi:MAG: 30S ribosomal protein S8 [Patescibacteria group bacterium]